jgi:hypothetical protein
MAYCFNQNTFRKFNEKYGRQREQRPESQIFVESKPMILRKKNCDLGDSISSLSEITEQPLNSKWGDNIFI